MDTHDPLRQVQQLRQVLAGDKMPTAFLLGAGCPCAIRIHDGAGKDRPLIPDVGGLTSAVCDQLSANEKTKGSISTILKQLDGKLGYAPNIEEILTQIRALRQVIGKDNLNGLSAADLDELDLAACQKIVDVVAVDLPSGEEPFQGLAKWISAISREQPVELFTTNYDLLIEQSLEASRVPYFDGFVGANKAFFDINSIEQDQIPIRWARVWKLHGSISWFQVEGGQVYRAHPKSTGARRLIHPSHLKYEESRRMPYLAMMDRLRAFLKQEPAAIFISGYSFSDAHLNELLVQGLEGNPSAACFALQFKPLASYKAAIKLAKARPNLNLLAPDGGIIGTREGKWMKSSSVDPALLGSAFRVEPGATGAAIVGDKINPAVANMTDPDAPQNASCLLGDFAALGKFLSDIAGSNASPSDSNAA